MKHLAPFLLLFVVGCTSLAPITPTTPAQRLLAAETSYNVALKTVDNLVATGTLVKGTDTAIAVKNGLLSVNAGLEAWNTNINSGEAEAAVMAALRAVNRLLAEIQR